LRSINLVTERLKIGGLSQARFARCKQQGVPAIAGTPFANTGVCLILEAGRGMLPNNLITDYCTAAASAGTSYSWM
jgi:hypothetical protein